MSQLTEDLRANTKKYLSINKPDTELLNSQNFKLKKYYREQKKVAMNKLVKLCLKTQDYNLLFKNKKHMCWNVQGCSKCWKYNGSMYRKQFVSMQ